MKDITFLVVTFLRDEYLYKCVKSIRDTYGNKPCIVVGDNGHPSKEKEEFCKLHGAEYYELPFDSGVGGSRNLLMEKVKTKYVLVGDDDFIYSKKAGADIMVDFLRKNKEVDLVGGRICEFGNIRNYQGNIEIGNHYLKYSHIDDNKIGRADIVFNYFVAKRSLFDEVQWDSNIKVRHEHSDFFIALKKAGKVVYYHPKPIVQHKADGVPSGEGYIDYRHRKDDDEYFVKKHDLKWTIGLNGRKTIWSKKYPGMIGQVDFIIKTFMRYESLENLLFSIVKYYPEANIYIADDGGKFDKKYYTGLWDRLFEKGLVNKPVAFNLKFDMGLSAARNYLVEKTPNRYILLLDDDFVFTEKTTIEDFVVALDENKDIGVVGGSLYQDGSTRHYEGFLNVDNGILKQERITDTTPGIKRCDIVFNFALFRREVFDSVKWDPDIKISGEHTDFYLRLKKETDWKVGYLENVQVDHIQNYPEGYAEMRKRDQYWKKIFGKHNIYKIINFNGVVSTYIDGVLTKSRI